VKSRFKYNNFQKCDYCKKTESSGVVFHIPEIPVIYEVLKKYLSDITVNKLSDLVKVYKILSDHFVHFSTEVSPDQEKYMVRINGKDVNLLDYDGVKFVLQRLSFILCNYFMILKNKFAIHEYPSKCETLKNGFQFYFCS